MRPVGENLSVGQISLQSKREEILARKGKENQIAGLKRGDSVPAKLPKREPVSTRAECAKAAGRITGRSVEAGGEGESEGPR